MALDEIEIFEANMAELRANEFDELSSSENEDEDDEVNVRTLYSTPSLERECSAFLIILKSEMERPVDLLLLYSFTSRAWKPWPPAQTPWQPPP
eukprot:scaffold35204_cov48-Phaeocystis_antarctica.AAC.3